MAVFSAYCDTSGDLQRRSHGTALVTVGLLGSEAQWTKFVARWGTLLGSNGLDFLHMRVLSQHFRNREDEKVQFLAEAVKLLRKFIAQSFVTSVIPYEYDLVNAEYHLDAVMRSPFACAAGSSAMFVGAWFNAQLNSERIHTLDVAHESGDDGTGDALDVAKRHGFALRMLPSSTPGAAAAAFQAADFVAWEVRRVLELLLQQKQFAPRQAVIDISCELTKQVHMWNRESLTEICEKNRIRKRDS